MARDRKPTRSVTHSSFPKVENRDIPKDNALWNYRFGANGNINRRLSPQFLAITILIPLFLLVDFLLALCGINPLGNFVLVEVPVTSSAAHGSVLAAIPAAIAGAVTLWTFFYSVQKKEDALTETLRSEAALEQLRERRDRDLADVELRSRLSRELSSDLFSGDILRQFSAINELTSHAGHRLRKESSSSFKEDWLIHADLPDLYIDVLQKLLDLYSIGCDTPVRHLIFNKVKYLMESIPNNSLRTQRLQETGRMLITTNRHLSRDLRIILAACDEEKVKRDFLFAGCSLEDFSTLREFAFDSVMNPASPHSAGDPDLARYTREPVVIFQSLSDLGYLLDSWLITHAVVSDRRTVVTTSFDGCIFWNRTWHNFDFLDCRFLGTLIMRSRFFGCSFQAVNTVHALLASGHVSNCSFSDCRFEGTDLSSTKFRNTGFYGCAFRRGFWNQTCFTNVAFKRCRIAKVYANGSRFTESHIVATYIRKSDLSSSYFQNLKFSTLMVISSKLHGANFYRLKYEHEEDKIKSSIRRSDTTLIFAQQERQRESFAGIAIFRREGAVDEDSLGVIRHLVRE